MDNPIVIPSLPPIHWSLHYTFGSYFSSDTESQQKYSLSSVSDVDSNASQYNPQVIKSDANEWH